MENSDGKQGAGDDGGRAKGTTRYKGWEESIKERSSGNSSDPGRVEGSKKERSSRNSDEPRQVEKSKKESRGSSEPAKVERSKQGGGNEGRSKSSKKGRDD